MRTLENRLNITFNSPYGFVNFKMVFHLSLVPFSLHLVSSIQLSDVSAEEWQNKVNFGLALWLTWSIIYPFKSNYSNNATSMQVQNTKARAVLKT